MLQKIFDEIISDYYFIDNETLLIYKREHNKFLQQFSSINASKHIGECCRGNKKTYMGYEWKFKTIS